MSKITNFYTHSISKMVSVFSLLAALILSTAGLFSFPVSSTTLNSTQDSKVVSEPSNSSGQLFSHQEALLQSSKPEVLEQNNLRNEVYNKTDSSLALGKFILKLKPEINKDKALEDVSMVTARYGRNNITSSSEFVFVELLDLQVEALSKSQTLKDDAISTLNQAVIGTLNSVVGDQFEYIVSDVKLQQTGYTATDPGFVNGTQWYLKNTGNYGGLGQSLANYDINPEEAWNYGGVGNSDVKILFIDVINQPAPHPDLDLTSPKHQTYLLPGQSLQYSSHATAAYSIVAAKNNGQNLHGICPGCSFVTAGITTSGDLISILNDTALMQTVDVVNLSIALSSSVSSGYYSNPLAYQYVTDIQNAINNVTTNYKTVVVGAAANCGTWSLEFNCDTNSNGVKDAAEENFKAIPASLNNVISVANLDKNGVKHFSSNYGNWIDISAPGTSLESIVYNGSTTGIGTATGTSFAAPVVTGVVGLLKSQNPNLTHNEVLSILTSTANPQSNSINSSFANQLGAGTVDAGAAILELAAIPSEFNVSVTPDTLTRNNSATASTQIFDTDKVKTLTTVIRNPANQIVKTCGSYIPAPVMDANFDCNFTPVVTGLHKVQSTYTTAASSTPITKTVNTNVSLKIPPTISASFSPVAPSRGVDITANFNIQDSNKTGKYSIKIYTPANVLIKTCSATSATVPPLVPAENVTASCTFKATALGNHKAVLSQYDIYNNLTTNTSTVAVVGANITHSIDPTPALRHKNVNVNFSVTDQNKVKNYKMVVRNSAKTVVKTCNLVPIVGGTIQADVTCSFTPSKAGNYTATITTTDLLNYVTSYTTPAFNVGTKPPTVVSSFSNPTTRGSNISFTANINDELKTKSYSVKVYTPANVLVKTCTQTLTIPVESLDINPCVFKPTLLGTYKVNLTQKDAFGNTFTHTNTVSSVGATINVGNIPQYPLLNEDLNLDLSIEDLVNKVASYSVSIKKTGATKAVTLTDPDCKGVYPTAVDSVSKTCTFKPTSTGTYTITVTVKDSLNYVTTKAYKISVLTKVQPTITPIVNPTPAFRGQELNLSFNIQDANKTRSFAITVYRKGSTGSVLQKPLNPSDCKQTVTTPVEDYTTPICKYKLTAVGTYILRISQTDDKGIVSTLYSTTITVTGAQFTPSVTPATPLINQPTTVNFNIKNPLKTTHYTIRVYKPGLTTFMNLPACIVAKGSIAPSEDLNAQCTFTTNKKGKHKVTISAPDGTLPTAYPNSYTYFVNVI